MTSHHVHGEARLQDKSKYHINTGAMILRPYQTLSRPLRVRFSQAQAHRSLFGASSTRSNQNRIFDNIRTPNDLHTLTLLSAAENRPLITLWSASWCTTCQVVKPLIKGMIEDERVGEEEGGLGFAEVEMDSTLIGDLGVKYMVRVFGSIPAHCLPSTRR